MIGFIILLFLIGGFLYWNRKGCKLTCSKESYGQDPSIRASTGWLAGTGMYGYDPIQRFAEQIEMANRHPGNPQAQAIARQQLADMGIQSDVVEGFCDPRPSYWDVNFLPRNYSDGTSYTGVAYPSYPQNSNRLIYAGNAVASPSQAGPCCGMGV